MYWVFFTLVSPPLAVDFLHPLLFHAEEFLTVLWWSGNMHLAVAFPLVQAPRCHTPLCCHTAEVLKPVSPLSL